MGLLDEAIREHLELKRRRGADPTEVAREEQEALEPIFPDEAPAAAYDDAQPPPLEESQPAYEDYAEQAAPTTATTLGEETVEIDMQAVLDADQAVTGHGPAAAMQPAQEAGFEWEVPERAAAEPPPEPIPGQERLSFE